MDILLISQFLFFLGFIVMVINETPVVLRHVFKPAMDFRKEMEARFGDKWRYWHKIIDYIWNLLFIIFQLLSSIGITESLLCLISAKSLNSLFFSSSVISGISIAVK